MNFDTRYQAEKNGPLKKELTDRIRRFRSFFTLAEIGGTLGFSGAFISQILNEKTPARVDSKHIPRIVKALSDAEAKYQKKLGLSDTVAPVVVQQEDKHGLDYHLSAIDALGWKVSGLERKV